MNIKEKIVEYIDAHRQEMIEDICTLCKINSEKMEYEEGKPYGVGPYMVLNKALAISEQYGFSIRNYDNFVGTVDFNDKERQLDILAHLDIVPAGEGWNITQPFEPIEVDGKLYGRGTADDKGPAVAALYAMRAIKELEIPLEKNVRLIMGTDEECGSTDIAHYYKVEKEAPMTFSPDAEFPVTNTEKGRLAGHFVKEWNAVEALPKLVSLDAGIKVNVVPGKAFAVVAGLDYAILKDIGSAVEKETGAKFELDPMDSSTKIMAIGDGAHAAHPTDGTNALTALLTFLAKLPFAPSEMSKAICDLAGLIPHGDTSGQALGVAMKDDLSGDLTLAFSMLQIHETGLEGFFDTRCPICSNEENTLNVIKEKFESKGFGFLTDEMRPSHHVPEESHFVQTLLNAYEDYTGLKGKCLSTGGGTYVHDLEQGVAFGATMPGTDNHMHGADEYAVIDELLTSAKIFAQVIVDLCSQS